MSNYIPSNSHNPCPICDDISGKCRSTEDSGKDFYLCMTEMDAHFGDIINGHKCIKENDPIKSYPCTTWVENNSAQWTSSQKEEWENRKRLKKERLAKDIAAQKKRSLSPEERDKGYRTLVNQLTLHPEDRADLIKRGFTEEQIQSSGFKSVSKNEFLKTAVDANLPGVRNGGKNLAVYDDGILIPIKNGDGLIVGCQIRLRNPIDGNRYRWLSSKNILHLFPNNSKEGELPLAVVFPNGSVKTNEINLVEGTGAKPFLAAHRLNQITIGAAGGQFLASKTTLKNTLEKINPKNKVKINIFPDAGDILNPSVMNRWKNTINHLKKLGYQINIKWWNQAIKNDCDIDELELHELTNIQSISPNEFFALPNKPEIRKLNRNEESWKNWRAKKLFTGTISFKHRYISDGIKSGEISLPKLGECTAINSGLGSGKTTLIYKLLEAYPDLGSLYFGARNFLLLQFAGEAGFYHLQTDLKDDKDALRLISDPQSKITAAIDSIIYFSPSDFDDKILLLDEFESTIKHLLFSSTSIAQWREKAKQLLIEAFKRCEAIVILDGNLKDITIELLQKLFATHGIDKKITKIKNLDNSLTSNEVRFYVGAEINGELNKNDRSVFLRYLLENSEADPFVVVSDNQIFLEGLDNALQKQGLRGLRIDSSTTNNSDVSIFLSDSDAPKEWILENRPDYLLLSPSLENGGNIDIPGYFKNIYGYFCGVFRVDEQLQILRRVRDENAILHIFCKPTGLPDGVISTSPFPREIENAVSQYLDDCADATLEGYREIIKLVKELKNIRLKSDFFKYECQLTTIANHERFNLRECLLESLENKGYKITLFSECKSEDVIKPEEEEVKTLRSEQIFNEIDITTEEAEEIMRNPKVPMEKKNQALRRRLLDKLPGIEGIEIDDENGEKVPLFSPEFIKLVLFKDRKLISNLSMLHFLINPELAHKSQLSRWHKKLEKVFLDENPQEFQLSTHYKSLWLKIKTLNELGITKFFEPGKTWTSDDADVINVFNQAKKPSISRAIGIKPGDDSPSAFLGRLLKSLGFLTESTRVRSGGKQERIYSVRLSPFDDPIKASILKCVGRKITSEMAEKEVKNFDKILEVATGSNPGVARFSGETPSADISYIKTGEGVSLSLEENKAREEDPSICQVDRSESQADRPDIQVDRSDSSPESVNAPLETLESSEPHEYERIAAKLAASAHNLEMVKSIVAEYGWEKCDDAAIFAPIQVRSHLNKCLKKIALEPVT